MIYLDLYSIQPVTLKAPKKHLLSVGRWACPKRSIPHKNCSFLAAFSHHEKELTVTQLL